LTRTAGVTFSSEKGSPGKLRTRKKTAVTKIQIVNTDARKRLTV
jgi:hypothetical protein